MKTYPLALFIALLIFSCGDLVTKESVSEASIEADKSGYDSLMAAEVGAVHMVCGPT